MLEAFRKAKEPEVRMLLALDAAGRMPSPYAAPRRSFTEGLATQGRLPVIAEYKRASPSQGDINLNVTPEDVAAAYASAGAGALSVLTEEHFFKGSLGNLSRMTAPGLPLLRKDFIIHPLQVEQTAATPASAILLIARMLEETLLAALIIQSLSHGLEPVVEVFDLEDLSKARTAGARILQVNNRDLDTLAVTLDTSRNLVKHKKASEFWITASGIATPDHLHELLGLGFNAALIGTSLMQGDNPGQGLKALLHQSSTEKVDREDLN